MAGPLDGVRILDLSGVIAGSLCSYQLALLGADIIKVEAPGAGDIARRLGGDPALNARLMGASFLSNNAGKRSVALDLKKPGALEVLSELTRRCDVLLENFRPGTMKRLGFDYEKARALKPDLVWCSVTGFGQTGPLRDRPAYDQIVQGYCGVMSLTGTAETAPNRVGYQICDTIAAITASFAISAALYRKKATGEGEFIDLAMLDSSLASLPSWPMSNLLNAGLVPRPMGNDNAASAPSGAFRTKKGPINIVANDQRQFESLCEALSAPEIKDDPRFVDRPTRMIHREELRKAIEARLASRTAVEWDAILAEANVPAGPIFTLPEIAAHPQVEERQLLKTFDDGTIGREFVVHRLGFQLGSGLPDVDKPPPRLGQHTEEVLEWLGYSPEAIAGLKKSGTI
jgi:crotonobetainyl-CoA:carnitine CoA-transferase CaiB-like acyl-CoA transferase